MTGQQLKNSLLQWAIQGKLVPQDPNDEPATVLLEKIRAEKARLIKEGKIKRDKKESIIYRGEDNSYYEKFADGKVVCIDGEIPFEIPSSWEWCRIWHLFVTSSGSTPQSKNPLYYSNGTINWVRTTDLNNGILDSCEIQITPKAVLDYNLSIIPQESICIAMYGGGGTIGKHSIIRFDTTINQSVCAIHPNFMCNMEYVHIFMQYQRPYWMDYAAGSRKDPNINQIIIKNCLIPIPPKKEQDRIVSKYNALFPLIDNYSEANEQRNKLNEDIACTLKKSILQEAIQGRLVPQCASDEPASVLLQRIWGEKQRLIKEGKLKKKEVVDTFIYKGDDNKYYEQIGQEIKDVSEELPFEIPETWEWCRLRDLCLIFTGATFRKDEAKTDCKGVRILRGGNILPFEIVQKTDDIFLSPEQVKDSILLKQNDIITPAVTSLENIGKMARVEQDMPNVTVGGFVFVLRPHYSDEWLSKFLLFFMSSLSAIEFMKSITNKSGQAFYNIGKERLAMTLVPIPPKDEEQRIVEKIEDLFDRIKG